MDKKSYITKYKEFIESLTPYQREFLEEVYRERLNKAEIKLNEYEEMETVGVGAHRRILDGLAEEMKYRLVEASVIAYLLRKCNLDTKYDELKGCLEMIES